MPLRGRPHHQVTSNVEPPTPGHSMTGTTRDYRAISPNGDWLHRYLRAQESWPAPRLADARNRASLGEQREFFRSR